jgi:hypothetical protein
VHAGILRDLKPRLGEEKVLYSLLLDDQEIPLNPLIGADMRLTFAQEKECVFCGRKVKKLFGGGSCWPCFQRLAINDLCQVKPTLCHYETCREPEWGDAHCMIPTYVYLAKSSDIKVGITRNLPGRWMDQGAVEAVVIGLLPTRKMAGELELFLSGFVKDRTDWRKMLRGETAQTSLLEVRERLLPQIPDEYRAYLLPSEPVLYLNYPVQQVPERIAAHDLEKAPAEGRLLGIKGSYLILDTGVLNVPKFAGFKVRLETLG